jgi:dynein heavy chain
MQYSFPAEGMLYDYKFDATKKQWINWMDDAPAFNPGNSKSTDVIVPTLDTVRYSFLVELLLGQGCHFLATGSTGMASVSIFECTKAFHV